MITDLSFCNILVTATSYGKENPNLIRELEAQVGRVEYNPYGRPLTSQELAGILPAFDGMIAGLDFIDKSALQDARRLKVIARYGVGVDRVDLQAAQHSGIVVTNTPGANSVSVAELAIGLMLGLSRSIPQSSAATKNGQWPRLSGVCLEGKTVGLLGFGSIGKQVARRLSGFDCTLMAYDIAPDLEFASQNQVQISSMENIIARADFLSLHLPALPETLGLVDARFLARMKRGAYLINTARGELVDETALYEALVSGHLRGAALDTYTKEPPDPTYPLFSLPQVIAMPHAGAHSDSATNRMGCQALKDCLAVLRGEVPDFKVA